MTVLLQLQLGITDSWPPFAFQVLESAFYPTHTYSAIGADVWAVGILLCHMFFGAHTPYW